MKALEKRKRQKLGTYNNLSVNADTRWTGFAGEFAFEKMLKEFYPSIEYNWHWRDDSVDDLDFTLFLARPLLIDVKTLACNVEQQLDYQVNLNQKQAIKIQSQWRINTLVFASYLLPEDKVTIHGWLVASEFFEKSELIQKGQTSNKMVMNASSYCAPLSALKPFGKVVNRY